jgi:hypothetical protein
MILSFLNEYLIIMILEIILNQKYGDTIKTRQQQTRERERKIETLVRKERVYFKIIKYIQK